MGAMSDLDLLATRVNEKITDDGMSLDDAMAAVARNTTYKRREIEMAYRMKHGRTLTIDSGGRYNNVMLGDDMIASFDPGTGEFAVYQPDDDEPVAVHDLDV